MNVLKLYFKAEFLASLMLSHDPSEIILVQKTFIITIIIIIIGSSSSSMLKTAEYIFSGLFDE